MVNLIEHIKLLLNTPLWLILLGIFVFAVMPAVGIFLMWLITSPVRHIWEVFKRRRA
jgi:hypothetical protein